MYPADMTGCGHYRMIWPAEALQKAGKPITIMPPGARHSFRARVVNGEVEEVFLPPDADTVVFQRLTMDTLAKAVPVMRAQGVRVVIDMDDDLSCIHPDNPAWAAFHPRKTGNPRFDAHSWENAQKACDAADLVTVSSDALAQQYGKHGRVQVIRNRIPDSMLAVQHEDSDVIGWAGAVHSHPDDPREAAQAVQRLVDEGHRFMVAGPEYRVRETFGVDKVDITGAVDLHDWPNAVSRIGIGIAPLVDSKFNNGKSWLKPMEYAAVGVPVVMSDRPEYRQIAALGIGTIADKPRHWYNALKKLTTDDIYRRDESARCREIAATWVTSSAVNEYSDAWDV